MALKNIFRAFKFKAGLQQNRKNEEGFGQKINQVWKAEIYIKKFFLKRKKTLKERKISLAISEKKFLSGYVKTWFSEKRIESQED